MFNTAPAAVPQFQKQGGLVPLDDFPDGRQYIEDRTGDIAEQYQSPDGKYYQLPWKSNPVVIFYNKKAFTKAGIDAENPPLSTYDEFLATARKVVKGGGAKYAILPAPTSEFFQTWFDFYPLYAAETGGKQLVEDGKATFAGDEGKRVAAFWKTLYDEGLAGKEKYNGDAFADGKAAMAIVGPWAIPVYKDKVEWGSVPVPTSKGTPASEIHTFSDAKNVAMYSACENRGTAWELMKFATSEEQDGALLEATGQMPLRDGPGRRLPGLLHEEPGVHDVRRPDRAHGRGAERAELHRHLAGPARRVQQLGDLRQVRPGHRAVRRGRPRSTSSPASPDRTSHDPHPASGGRPAVCSAASRSASPSSRRTRCSWPAIFAYPLGIAVYMSFHDWFFAAPGAVVDRPFVGLRQLRRGVHRPRDPAVVPATSRSSW